MRGSIHHLDLTVKDPWASRHFYAQVLGFMGYRQIAEDDRGFDFAPADGTPSIGLKMSEGPNRERAHDRYSPGLHHVAWRAQSRHHVDGLYALLLRMEATILDAPADYPQYGDGYYAVFFADPDGLKLEFVFEP